jgi:hypothetical protein
MRGSHSTRFQLAHGRPSDETEREFLPGSASNALSKPKARRMGSFRVYRWNYDERETAGL